MKNLQKELLEKAMNLTTKNIVKKTRTKSMNHRIVEVLKDGSKKTRVQIVNEITLLRLQEKYTEAELEIEFEKLNEDFLKEFNKLNRTCKNGVDTSLADGQTNANFSYNTEFNKNWKIIKADGNISLKAIK